MVWLSPRRWDGVCFASSLLKLASVLRQTHIRLLVDNWNAFGCDVDEGLVLDTASTITHLGLQDLGYHYVVIDDCWSNGRDGNNQLQADTTKFPNGMTHVGDQLHAQGLGFGMYSDAGSSTVSAFDRSLLQSSSKSASNIDEKINSVLAMLVVWAMKLMTRIHSRAGVWII